MKRKIKKTALLCLTLLATTIAGCGQQAASSGASTAENIQTVKQAGETSATESEGDSSLADTEQESSPLSSPISYEEYITDENGNPVLGYNIPLGWHKDETDTVGEAQLYTFRHSTSFDPLENAQTLTISTGEIASYWYGFLLDDIEGRIVAEETSYASPIGTFHIFHQEWTSETAAVKGHRFAVLTLDDDSHILVESIAYDIDNNDPTYYTYHDSMEDILEKLFGEKTAETKISIPENYTYYIKTKSGDNLFGVNVPEGYERVTSFLNDSIDRSSVYDYSILLTDSDSSDNEITVAINYDAISVYDNQRNEIQYSDTYKTEYTQKGELNTIYGPAKLYDTETTFSYTIDGEDGIFTSSTYAECALIKLNGTCFEITYYNIFKFGDRTDEISDILDQLLAQ